MLNVLKYIRKTNTVDKCICNKSSTYTRISKPQLRNPSKTENKIGPFGWFLLAIPVSTFALGTWQVQRKKWKENLIIHLKKRTNMNPIALPQDLNELQELEFRPVYVRGSFLHDKELYMGPRSLLKEGNTLTKSTLFTKSNDSAKGYLVITPFKLCDRKETILINRGWVPEKYKDPKTRKNGQVEGDIDLTGIVRLHENRPQFMLSNQEKSNSWFYRDLEHMSKVTGTSLVFLDATNDFDIPGGPIGGQTRVTLRNEHMSYILTWYSLCGATGYMWYRKFIKKLK